MNKSFWIILVGAVVALGGIFIVLGGKAEDTASGEFAFVEPLINQQEHDHATGEGKKATIVEYADFQCPYCGTYFPLLDQVKQTYGDDVKVIFRNFPIPSSHPQALAAHRAAEAASRQDKFWEMHDLIFSNQEAWSGNDGAATLFETFAEQLGLNMETYRADVESESVLAKITADTNSGKSLNVKATPTIFLNGEVLETPPTSLEEWDKLINGGGEEQGQE